ncbi:hypothetical protein P9D81_07845 [Bacillus haynesii]|uniref:hypothetical protein n=1 Tax=Bacillus haynesii TaxID=1925021 RepID=UPI0022832418|nr:hypothetical protein [Bacillus haynesii]MCY7928097.1 hypothetical protein [Bacillus haynesii]MCY8772388.1 hypothetical protein [Bacillus haynesii]MEC0789464.1 hypothetical protein [Bacillus haynesii]MEC1654765.1 hypothetical protein [Bacillus haynesii]
MNIKEVLLLLLEVFFDTKLILFGYPVSFGFFAIVVYFAIKYLYLKIEERIIVKVLEKIQQ